MNRGVLTGTARPGFQLWEPTLRAFVTAGTAAPTQPALGNATRWAEFMVKPTGRVFYRGGITFGSTTTYGAGEHVWAVDLPVPANRSSGGADIPVGRAWAWQGTAASPQLNVVLTPTLMDPFEPGGRQSQEDSWLHFFTPYVLAKGTGTIASGATAVTVTHGLVDFDASAYDVQVVPTATTTNNCGIWFVDTVTATGFNVNVRSNPGASGFAFAWKVRGEPNGTPDGGLGLLINRNRPYSHVSGHSIAWSVEYEARR